MSKHLFKYIISVCFVCFFLSVSGCGDKKEPQTKPAAVSKKIVVKKSDASPTADISSTITVPAKQGSEIKEKTVAQVVKPTGGKEKPVDLIQEPKVQVKPLETVKTEQVKKDTAKPTENPASAAIPAEIKSTHSSISQPPVPSTAAEIAKIETETIPIYNPQGRIDPFVPLFKDEGPLTGAEKERKGRVPRTPLEMIDLGQLKLVAVLRAPSGNKALVEEASGKGYIVAKGTYLGINSGRVVKILKDRIIIEEEAENIVGKSTIQERELKLQKPLGEE